MKVEVQVLFDETVEVQFEDDLGRVGTVRLDPIPLLDKQEVENICRLLNELSDKTNVCWNPLPGQGLPRAQATQFPVDESQSKLWRNCDLLELREELRDHIAKTSSWLAIANTLLPSTVKAVDK